MTASHVALLLLESERQKLQIFFFLGGGGEADCHEPVPPALISLINLLMLCFSTFSYNIFFGFLPEFILRKIIIVVIIINRVIKTILTMI